MAVDIGALTTELNTDPTGLGYSLTDHVLSRDIINQIRSAIQIDRDVIPSYEVLDATVAAEYTALSADEKDRYALFVGAGEINVKSANTRAAFLAMFAGGTTTRSNLGALQSSDSSRAQQLFGSDVQLRHVIEALGIK